MPDFGADAAHCAKESAVGLCLALFKRNPSKSELIEFLLVITDTCYLRLFL